MRDSLASFADEWNQPGMDIYDDYDAGEWRGDVSKEALGEAVRLASQAFAEHADEYTPELAAA